MKKIIFTIFISIIVILSLFLSAFFILLVFDLREKNTKLYAQEDERQKKLKAERKRIEELPEIKGILYAKDNITSKISEQKSGLYLIAVGEAVKVSGSPKYIIKSYDDKYIVQKSNNAKISIGKILYPIDFKLCIPTNIYYDITKSRTSNEKLGYWSSYYIKTASALYFRFPKFKEEDISKLRNFQNQHELINKYFNQSKEENFNIIVREYFYNSGDTLSFKGKIENGKIIPLF